MMCKRFEEAKRSIVAADKRTRELFASVQNLKEERTTLQWSIKSLEAVEKKYETFKDREPEIKHYLRQFASIAR
jgi:seryl-tRNA synthetase